MAFPPVVLLTLQLLHPSTVPVTPVDFRLMPSGAVVAESGHMDQANTPHGSTDTSQTPTRRSSRPAAGDAGPARMQGYGTDIPLPFAVRQIVPRGIRVVYGPGVTPETTVSWTGGKVWYEVLRDALKPQRLRLLLSGQTATIAR